MKDACTGLMVAFFLATKESEGVIKALDELDALAQRVVRGGIKVMRTDMGREFTGRPIEKYCREKGFQLQRSANHRHHFTSHIEREWRTHQEITRTLLLASGAGHG